MLERVNERHPELGMTAIDDVWPEENFYGRSDHYNFALSGIPVLFFTSGQHPDYHQPYDTADKIEYDVLQKRATLVFQTACSVANPTR